MLSGIFCVALTGKWLMIGELEGMQKDEFGTLVGRNEH
jgi:hypothetical protein